MENYKCIICGYVYEPISGDLKNNISEGTAFSDLPAHWLCPICNAEKEQFIEI